MPYRVRIHSVATRAIARWKLPDPVLVEVHLRLREELPSNPHHYLQRSYRPFNGMVYRFSLVDPENRLSEHFFEFQVFYLTDEETLLVGLGNYIRLDGL